MIRRFRATTDPFTALVFRKTLRVRKCRAQLFFGSSKAPSEPTAATSVWSLALRRANRVDETTSNELAELVREGRVVMMGAIRQEILSGMKSKAQFELLRARLRAFPDIQLDTLDYEEAAAAFNRCRERGIQGSNTDFLICSVALRRDLAVYTTDNDFVRYANMLKFDLHEPRG